jgi:hypothetical protein
MKQLTVLILAGLLLLSGAWAQPVSRESVEEVPVYQVLSYLDHAKVEMGYASSRITNPHIDSSWQHKTIKRIDLVFSRYPQDLDAWIIPYDRLFADRMSALQALDTALFGDEDIEWRYIMQTDCATERQAQQLYHGFVVYFESMGSSMEEVAAIAYQQDSLRDSTALQVLDRYPEWDQMLVVMDWTGSMYKYGASVLLWHRLNAERRAVKHFVFFNDGDGRDTGQKKPGRTGGIYKAESNGIDTVLRKMNQVMVNGHGGDGPENDIEALYKGMKYLDGYDAVILIADNRSDMRDLHLVQHLKKPIKVILCGVDEDHPVNAEYLTLARATGGSVHTIEEDLERLKAVSDGAEIVIKGFRYRLEQGRFRLIGPEDRM